MGKAKLIAKPKASIGALEECLKIEKFVGLSSELATWRLNPMISLMEVNKAKGRILGFVKGLRFSARIAYLIRNIVSSEDVEVNWGHLIDNKGKSCSPECDIIIHRNGCIRKWNGEENHIMDFRFIKCEDALAVISCKSKTASIDKEYCEDFRKYELKNIFLFAECCLPKSIDRLKTQAISAGYKGFYYLYAIDKKGNIKCDEKQYLAFIKEMENVAKLANKK